MQTLKNIIDLVRKTEPTITSYGLTTDFTYANHPIDEKEFELCITYLQTEFEKRRAENIVSSYALKHEVERWTREIGNYSYISNGSAAAAAIYLGFTYRVTSYNIDLIFPGAIIQVQGIMPLVNKPIQTFTKGEIVYQSYKLKNRKENIYEVRAGVITSDVIRDDLYTVTFPMKKGVVVYDLYSTEMGKTTEMAVRYNWLII